ncbi:hypothetical protein KQX54_012659 [Cotesia glomerata]|uniref:Peptidase A2 domain-containing protein n=1 Tax=Cotesia glomerata TaxID=32391 RepID=A0AAV7I246_COTGL|nr:hypothetical protein KQX54_012659 [Cotesia glomerata]
MNSTTNPAVDPGNVSTAHVSGIQPLAESESANSSTQVLQGVIQQLRAEIQAMRAAQQGLPPTCTSTTSHTNTIPVNSNVPVDSFGNNFTFYPRELFPVPNAQPAPQPLSEGIPPYFYPPASGAQRSCAFIVRAATYSTTTTNITSTQYSPTCTDYISPSTEATGILLYPAQMRINLKTSPKNSPLTRVSRMLAEVTIGSHRIEALLDSGSERSYISAKAYKLIQGSELQKLGPDPTSTFGVTLADSAYTYTQGGAPFRIELDSLAIFTWLSVLPGLSTPMILGLDFWQRADVRVESKAATWQLGDN